MKKLITTCLMLAAVTTVSLAQTKKTTTTKSDKGTTAPGKATPATKAEKKAKAAQTAFGLNAEQYKGIYDIELKYEGQLFDLAAIGETASEGRMLQLNMFRDGGYKMHLTDAQYAQYELNKNP